MHQKLHLLVRPAEWSRRVQQIELKETKDQRYSFNDILSSLREQDQELDKKLRNENIVLAYDFQDCVFVLDAKKDLKIEIHSEILEKGSNDYWCMKDLIQIESKKNEKSTKLKRNSNLALIDAQQQTDKKHTRSRSRESKHFIEERMNYNLKRQTKLTKQAKKQKLQNLISVEPDLSEEQSENNNSAKKEFVLDSNEEEQAKKSD